MSVRIRDNNMAMTKREIYNDRATFSMDARTRRRAKSTVRKSVPKVNGQKETHGDVICERFALRDRERV